TVRATAPGETERKDGANSVGGFKGAGNGGVGATRSPAGRRIYPAVDIAASGTRREELLADAKTVESKQTLRRALVDLPPEQAMQRLLQQIKREETNAELLSV